MEINVDINSIYQKLAEEISYVADKKDKEIKRDFTFGAQVTGVTDKGKYEIQYKGKTYSARCDIPLSSGAWVNVCAPQNNWSELYIQDGGIKVLHQRIDDLEARIAKLELEKQTT